MEEDNANNKIVLLIVIAIIAIAAVIIGVILLSNNDETTNNTGQLDQNQEDQTQPSVVGTPPELAQKAADWFGDVDANYVHAEAIGWLAENKITTGCKDGNEFCPDRDTSRREMAIFLWRAAGSPQPNKTGSEIFKDVEAGSTGDVAIGWLAERSITANENKFYPSDPASRGQIALFLYRYVGAPETEESDFKDVDSGSFYATAVGWLAKHNITAGCSQENFCPKDPASRAQVAQLMYRVESTRTSWGSNGGIFQQQ